MLKVHFWWANENAEPNGENYNLIEIIKEVIMSEILEANLKIAARMVISNNRRGRPRSKEAHHRIINSTLDLIAEKGFSGVTIETIARQAHVGKSTIYRHWKSKTELVEEAVDLEIMTLGNGCDSGDLFKDFSQAMENLSALFAGRTGIAFSKIVGEAQSNPKLRKLVQERWRANQNGALTKLVARGAHSGQIKDDVDPEMVAQLAIGILLLRSLVTGQSDAPLDCDLLAKVLLNGIAAAEPSL